MKITPSWNTKISSGYNFSQYGIIEANRFIYLFFPETAIENYKNKIINRGERIYGKAIIVNLSLSEGGPDNVDVAPWSRGSLNSSYMVLSMYTCNTIFHEHIRNIQESEFSVTYATSTSTMNDYDIRKAALKGISMYSKELRDKTYMRSMLELQDPVDAPGIPEPMYYTIREQIDLSEDFYTINDLPYTLVYNGSELIDDSTNISVMNMSLWDTFEPQIAVKISEIKNMVKSPSSGVNMYDMTQLSNWLLYDELQSMQHGYTYIYDSEMGVNIIPSRKGFLPFRKYQFEEKMVGDLERAKDIVERHGKHVEKQLGSVRLMFTPLYFGDKIDTYFKDWRPDNQPVLDKDMNIDTEYKLKDDMSERISELEDVADVF